MPVPRYSEIVDLIKKGSTVEAQEQIMELREATIELQEENIELKEQIRNLQEQLKTKQKLNFNRGVYWVQDENNQDGPFCPQCYDTTTLLVRLQDSDDVFICYTCKNLFNK